MNRNTVILLLLALGLGGVAWFATRETPPVELPRLKIAGYGAGEGATADPSAPAPEAASPIDGIELEVPGEPKIVLRREKDGDSVIWHLDAPRKGRAQGYLVDQILAIFKEDLVSREARRYKESDARLFGFEPARRIRLVAKSGGAVWQGADLVIGDVRRDRGAGADGSAVDTWVMAGTPSGEPVVWAVGRDLRTAVDKKLADLRDKLLLTWKASDLKEIRVTPAVGTPVVLAATSPEAPAPKEGETAAAAPTPTWSIAEPAGVKADAGVGTFATTLLGARAARFEAADFAAAKAPLAGPVWKLAVKGPKDEVATLVLADGGGDEIWGRLEGSDEVFALAGWTAKGIRKSLEDFRDREVAAFEVGAVSRLDAPSASAGDDGAGAKADEAARVVAVREGSAWRFEGGAGSPADPTAWLSDLRALKAQRWGRPNEAAATEALAKPDFSVKVVLEGRGEAVLVAGAVFDDDGQQLRWARWLGALAGEPFLVTDYMVKQLVVTAESLREKRLLAGRALNSVALAVGGEARWKAVRTDAGWTLEGLAEGERVKAAAISGIVDGLAGVKALSFETLAWEEVIKGLDAASQGALTLGDAAGATVTLRHAMPAEGDPKVTVDAGPLAGQVVTVSRGELEGWLKTRAELVEAAAPPAAAPPPAPASAAAPAAAAPPAASGAPKGP
jgi:hypothetical protein